MEIYIDKINRNIAYLEKLLKDNFNNHKINHNFIAGKIEGLKEARYEIEKENKLKVIIRALSMN